LTAHQLRHGYATLLHEADIDVKDAQDLLGHADASTTQNIYTEVSDRRRKAVAEKINSYLN
jgi:integrase